MDGRDPQVCPGPQDLTDLQGHRETLDSQVLLVLWGFTDSTVSKESRATWEPEVLDFSVLKVPRVLQETLVFPGLQGPLAPLRAGPPDPAGPWDSQDHEERRDHLESRDQTVLTLNLDQRETRDPQASTESQGSRVLRESPVLMLQFQETKETMETQAALETPGPLEPRGPQGEQGHLERQGRQALQVTWARWGSRAPGGLQV